MSATKPDFICIGYSKTATTWLFSVLRKHPDIYLTRFKELDYYWGKIPNDKWYTPLLDNRIGRTLPYYNIEGARRKAMRATTRFARRQKLRNPAELRRMLLYFWPIKTPSWYASLFDPAKICGDISPKMIRFMGEREITNLLTHNPDVRVMIRLRNPYTRAWSYAKMVYSRLNPKGLSQEEILHKTLHYSLKIDEDLTLWKKRMPSDQLRISYYEDLISDTSKHFSEVHKFIGLDYPGDSFYGESLYERKFDTSHIAIPGALQSFLKNTVSNYLKTISQVPTSRIESWQNEIHD